MEYQKHEIKCRCILSQFKNKNPPIFHSFVVFTILDNNNNVIPHYAQCDNCGIVHRVIDMCKSEIVQGKETLPTLPTIDELRLGIPKSLVGILDANKCPLTTWQEIAFILQNEKWPAGVILTTERIGTAVNVKFLHILGNGAFKVEYGSREDFLELK